MTAGQWREIPLAVYGDGTFDANPMAELRIHAW